MQTTFSVLLRPRGTFCTIQTTTRTNAKRLQLRLERRGLEPSMLRSLEGTNEYLFDVKYTKKWTHLRVWRLIFSFADVKIRENTDFPG